MPYVRIFGFVTLLLRLLASAGPVLAATPMPADQAFQLRAQLDEEEGIELTWTIAPGYYLYRDKIVVTLDGKRVRIATEKGEPKDDPNFGITEVYHAGTTATVPAELLPETGRIIVTYQGCGENTICYPPIAKTIDLATLLIGDASNGGAAPNASGGADDDSESGLSSWGPTSSARTSEPPAISGREGLKPCFRSRLVTISRARQKASSSLRERRRAWLKKASPK